MDRKNKKTIILLLCLSPILIFFISLFIGAYNIKPEIVIKTIYEKITFQKVSFTVESNVLFNIRLPRILLALLVGCALSLSSACFQATFRNPLVSEYILGVSAGAVFGASLSIAYLGREFPVQIFAFFGGISAVLLTYFLARTKGEIPVISLVLSGIITTAIFTAGNYIIRYLAEPEKLHQIVVWLMGSFSAASWMHVIISGPIILIGSFILFFLRWRLNVLSMGDEEAKALGLNVKKLKILIITLSTLITSSAIAVVGIIGWIGLMIPHIIRIIVRSDNRLVLPLSGILGATLLLVADDVVRLSGGIELPVGVLTTLVGAPFFAYLLKKSKGGGWE